MYRYITSVQITYTCIYAYTYICIYIAIDTLPACPAAEFSNFVNMCVCVSVCVCVYVCTCVYLYTRPHIYTCIRTNT